MLKHFLGIHFALTIFLMVLIFVPLGFSQVDLAQQAYAIFEQSCLNCHGEHGAFTEEIIIDHTALIETGAVVPRNPLASAVYTRLLEKDLEKRMPLGQPALSPAAIDTIRRWILAGAPDWRDTLQPTGAFITPKQMLETIEKHVNSLTAFDRPFARYFTTTHLYNAGERRETLNAYQRALSKLVNSLSWGRKVIKPKPIDPEATILYIDLRDYEWEIGTNRWTQIETVYPYKVEFNAPTQTSLRNKLENLRKMMSCEVPFIHVDWFLANASLPPLYHDILGLPETDKELETRLEVNVVENLRNAPGKRVWRAGFNASGVSNHNRVVERHLSRYGAYWKSYDFAGSVGRQDIFTHPLSFEHDGGEIIFNLPNGLQAYYLADAGGNRLDAAPIRIVSNPAASDPTVRNGLSCIGCHTEGMKTFEDQVRGVIEKHPNPPFDKARALSLYVEKATMDAYIAEDTTLYKRALEKTDGIFGGIEPIQRFHEAFHAPLDIAQAAAAVGLDPAVFLEKIHQNARLQNLGLLLLENGSMKRDTWTSKFSEIVFALDFPKKSATTPVIPQVERIPGASVHISDPNLRAVIADALETPTITIENMATLTSLKASNKDIRDLTGIEFAKNLEELWISGNPISDLSPLAGLKNLTGLGAWKTPISDLSPLAGLTKLKWLEAVEGSISDLSPIAKLTNLERLTLYTQRISDLSPLAGLKGLKSLILTHNDITDLSPLAGLINLEELRLYDNEISDISPLAGLSNLQQLRICDNKISDLSPLAKLIHLKSLELCDNEISDISPLTALINLKMLSLQENKISDVSPLIGLMNLEGLILQDNLITDISPLTALPQNPHIAWGNNPGFPLGGPKLQGPWLWMLVPGVHLVPHRDWLSEASGGNVTELQVATNGAIEGEPIGNNVWTPHKISSIGSDNVREMANALGWETGNEIYNHVIYGSISFNVPYEQETTMYLGCDDGVQVWLNGEVIYREFVPEGNVDDYQTFFPATLKQGRNTLLVAIDDLDFGRWSAFFGFAANAVYTMPSFAFSATATNVLSGDTFTLHLNAENVTGLAGGQFDLVFDPAVLEALEVIEGHFLKTGGGTTFFQAGRIDNKLGKITGLRTARISDSGVDGTGTLLSVTFIAKAKGETSVTLSNFEFGSSMGEVLPGVRPEILITVEDRPLWDVNRDGRVNVLDLILVAGYLGEAATAHPEADVNGDGVVSILDLIVVASHLGESAAGAAPSRVATDAINALDLAMIHAWIQQAHLEDDGSIAFKHGIVYLQNLLALRGPKETALLANYPNPFNPETWIPYQLSKDSNVTITIYDTQGVIVRRLPIGFQYAGFYTNRSRAAYWEGRNEIGESVASGMYFYQLQAGKVSLLRKMLILK